MKLFRTLEVDVEQEITDYAESTGWRQRKNAIPGRKGESDRSFARRGVLKILEIKRPGKEPTPLQLKRLQEWRDDGFEASWTDNLEDAKHFLDR